jgi:Kef-type K+ transport system membrane component KefB/nucleotide-binding universal stress UspA family protein
MNIGLLFLQVTLIVALGRLVGTVMTRLGQPHALGEMVAGIVLGPSLLGWVAPGVYRQLFPAESVLVLQALSQVGVVFFLFLIGLELDPRLLRSREGTAVGVAAASIAIPFALGLGLTFFLYPRVSPGAAPAARFGAVGMFMGAALSATAFPVLARILAERNLHRTRVGALAITCAAASDATAWCLLAVAVGVATVSGTAAVWSVLLVAVYLLTMFFLVRPFLRRLEVVYERQGRLSQPVVSLIFMLVLVSAYATSTIGLHALFGAFVMGCVMPKGTPFVRHLSEKLEDYTVVFLLPIFFAFAGLKTDVGLIDSPTMWGYVAVIVGVATVGKVGGSAAAARWVGVPWREASALGVLMNTRGLIVLVVLTEGLRVEALTPAVYAMMVVMTLVTTAMTTPLLNLVYPRKPFGVGRETASGGGRAEVEAPRGYSVLIPVSLPKSGGPLVQLADTLIGADREHSRLLAIHLRKPADHEAYRSGLDEASPGQDEALAPLLAQARGRSIPVEQTSFLSRDVPGDIATAAKEQRVDLVLMGFHKPVFGKTILGGTVHRVLQQCECDVAIFVDRGFRTARRVLVPYLGSGHDRLALELAARMARSTDVQVTVLHIVPPMRGRDMRTINAVKETVGALFRDATERASLTFRLIEDESPVGVVLHQSQTADLVIIGVAEEWGLESHLFGWRPERIARDCPSSLLIVRKAGVGAVTEPSAAQPPQAN